MKTAQSIDIVHAIQEGVISGLESLYGATIQKDQITMNVTRKEFEGDYTVVVFPFTRFAGKKPELLATELGNFLVEKLEYIEKFNVVKGFLNLVVHNSYWLDFLEDMHANPDFGRQKPNGRKVMVEFSSPNTNKPLHLGHIRNILLGWSTSKIYELLGFEVVKVQIVNDRGIAICKSMLAWELFGEGATPESAGVKSDHFVGKYYVLFQKKLVEEYKLWQSTEVAQRVYEQEGKKGQGRNQFFVAYQNKYFNNYSKLGAQAKEMLLKWEAGDEATIGLWKKMNNWVYLGFDETYNKLGVSFDKLYYESETYVLGKEAIAKGLSDETFYRKEDGSVWIDLESAKLDHKLVLRSDGTSVYMTQDIGTAQKRYEDFGTEKMIYVVGDEQNYHFKVLFEILKRLEEPFADGLFHLSYGMVDLPTGKMKSREGTVVDADDLVAEVLSEARKQTLQKGIVAELELEEQESIISNIGLAALKFFIIKVHPRKRMTFNPQESVDMQGQTGPYVQNAFVRMKSVIRKAGGLPEITLPYTDLQVQEKNLVSELYRFPEVVRMAGEEYDPSHIANYCYDLAKGYHKFWHDFKIIGAESEAAKVFRLKLSSAMANVLMQGMNALGIDMPEKM